MLEAVNLNFGYGNTPVIKNINLAIKPGDITVVIGPSGCGKTTLLRCIALLERPWEGEIRIDDAVYSYPWPEDKPFASPWPALTTVFQSLFLWPHLTLRENVLLPVRLHGIADGKDKLDELIDAFDMGAFIERFPNEASLGQKQRVALARALMLQPHYLLLDEITSALDVEQIAKILGHLKQLRGKDIGIFLITHLLGFARHAADQVVFMADGEIEESGSPDILKNPKTERLYQFLSVVAAAS
ncbi:MAG: ATP-binding cassette domain-containing protein [Alphaproteobacteria bacterium]|nr:ATP-binding cassette domain-containing protein [Alphaproteobacteria bacterium]